jgi:hypothetical protein
MAHPPMAHADAFDSTFHHRNLAVVLLVLRLAEAAGNEKDASRRAEPHRSVHERLANRAASAALARLEGARMTSTGMAATPAAPSSSPRIRSPSRFSLLAARSNGRTAHSSSSAGPPS